MYHTFVPIFFTTDSFRSRVTGSHESQSERRGDIRGLPPKPEYSSIPITHKTCTTLSARQSLSLFGQYTRGVLFPTTRKRHISCVDDTGKDFGKTARVEYVARTSHSTNFYARARKNKKPFSQKYTVLSD